ncbi:MAG: DNA alkylation repair protein [archaeon]|jgi:3-methyladenine DNA glycosylase AlkD
MATANETKKELQKLSNPAQAKTLQRFFKTGKGEYGEGDIFLGIKVPKQREVAKKFLEMPLEETRKLLDSEVHEHRMVGLFILVANYERAKKKNDENEMKRIFEFYLKHAKRINNWDLVDLSAPNISGNYLLGKNKKTLYSLAKSKNLWKKRISILSTYAFIKQNQFSDTLQISEILLMDKHDLIHKAVGWMLREVGKKNLAAEEKFLKKHYKKMPRTMLRYAIEKFPEKKRLTYLHATK